MMNHWHSKRGRWNLGVGLIVSLAIVSAPHLSRADAVVEWNEITTQAILTAGRSPLITALDYAIVQAAVYDVAVARILKLWLKTDHVTFTVTSTNPLAVQKTRPYSRLSDAVQETIDARVYVGIHFRNSDLVSRKQGKRVAYWAFKHFLRPLH
jgi:hypothetical protein